MAAGRPVAAVTRPRAILALAVVLALGLPATVGAKPGYEIKPKSLHLKLDLPASNGYSASIVTKGHRQVEVRVTRGDVSARYTALGRVSRRGIEADFGSFGQVSLRFRSKRRYNPSLIPGLKPPKSLRNQCKGRPTVAESGVFVGNVSFEGENGFTQVKANRQKGKVVRSYRRVCKGDLLPFAGKIREENVVLTAQAKQLGVTRILIAAQSSLSFGDEGFSFAIAIGGEKSKVGRVAISKAAFLIEEREVFAVSPIGKQPLTAKMKLRKPFVGTATYREEGNLPPTLTGNLGVRLPASGIVPLAGSEFEAELCRGSKEMFENCLDSLKEQLSLDYGSGSHSQPLALARLSSLR